MLSSHIGHWVSMPSQSSSQVIIWWQKGQVNVKLMVVPNYWMMIRRNHTDTRKKIGFYSLIAKKT